MDLTDLPIVVPRTEIRSTIKPSKALRLSPEMWRILYGLLLAIVVLSILAFFYMDGASLSCTSTVRGAPGDGTTGGVWFNYLWRENGRGPFAGTQYLTGAARGDALWQPVNIVNSGWSIPMYLLGLLAGPVCGYNLVIMLGFITTGLGMWLLVYFITKNQSAALLSSVTFAFSGFTQVKSEGHVSGVFLGLFPLLVLTLLWLCRKPSWRRAMLAAFVWSSLAYVDAYYLAFSLVLVAGLVIGISVSLVTRGRIAFVALKQIFGWTVIAGLLTLVLLSPFAYATLSNKAEITAERSRSISDVTTYSARPSEYLLPPRYNPFGESLGLWKALPMHGSNSMESTIYLGWIPMLLAVTATIRTIRGRIRHTQMRETDLHQLPDLLTGRWNIVCSLVGIALVGFVASLSPEFRLFGVPFPMPSRIIHTIFPQMRVFSRLFVVVHTAIVGLAAIGLCSAFTKIRRTPLKLSLALLIGALSLVESLAYSPGSIPVWSYTQAPQVYQYLKTRSDVHMVGVYPLETTADNPDKSLFTFQPVLDKPMLNPYVDSPRPDDPSDIARGLAALGDPQTVPSLRALGVDTVVVQTQLLGQVSSEDLSLMGLSFIEDFRYEDDDAKNQTNGGPSRWAYLSPFYDTDVFKIKPGPTASTVIALGKGWGKFERRGWSGSRWMEQGAQLTAVGLNQASGTVSVSFSAHSLARERHLEIMDGTTKLGTVVVPVEGTTVRFNAPVNRTLTLRSVEPPSVVSEVIPGSNDNRSLTISVFGLDVN